MRTKNKIVVVGAGFVGATVTYTLAVQHAASEIVVIDVNKEKAIGEVQDIKHGLCFLGETDLYAGDYCDIKGADIIILTAGAGRKPGETRLDLAHKNVAIAKGCTDEIMKHYDGGVILVVANPVDILTHMISKWTGLPQGMVFGSGTSLDSARFSSALSELTKVDPTNVHAYIIGEHGDSQVPVWSNTHIAGTPIEAYCRMHDIPLDDKVKEDILQEVKTGGAQIIRRKGATFYGVSVCVSQLVKAILYNSNTIHTVGTVLKGEFGISDVCVSLPSMVGGAGVSSVLIPSLTEQEKAALLASADACKAVLKEVENI